MTEQSAIELCIKHKDPNGFDHLVKSYRREAMGHALGFMGNQDDALEMCQEAFKKAYVAMPKLDKLDQFYPWFYSILRNSCFNALARKKTVLKNQEKLIIDREQNEYTKAPYSGLVESESKNKVWATLNQLPEDHREILVMKYFKGMKYDRIAETLKIPRGTVMSRLYAARKAFAGLYGDEEVKL